MDCWFHPINSSSCCFLPSSPSPTYAILCFPFIQLKLKSACVLDCSRALYLQSMEFKPIHLPRRKGPMDSPRPSARTQYCEKHNGRGGDWNESVSSSEHLSPTLSLFHSHTRPYSTQGYQPLKLAPKKRLWNDSQVICASLLLWLRFLSRHQLF